MAESDSGSSGEAGSLVSAVRNGVTVVTLVVGAVVSLNTFITTQASQKVTNYGDFRKAVKSEEDYWKGLYTDYEATFAGDLRADERRRNARLFVISQLTEHAVPDFAEYKVPDPLKVQAQKQFETYRVGLRQALLDKDTSSPSVVAKLQTQVQVSADASVQRPADGSVVPTLEKVAVSEPTATATPNLDTVVLSTGRAQGWDVDVFWCRGAGADEANYVTASAAANVLAGKAKTGTPLDAGKAVTLGRIRLRPLPAEINAKPGYRAVGAQLRRESAFGEPAAADAVLAVVHAAQPARFTPIRVSNRTPWYLSMFVCGPITPAPALTAQQTVPPAPRPSAPAR